MTDLSHIRNFSIIAHIDHGKSTLADRLMEQCRAVDLRQKAEQLLDSMDLERERGITIKATAVQLNYTADNGETYDLNLIDTPGHVDFNYEVSRSLAACEGAVLVVDASQGVEAQTLANTYLAIDAGLEVLPVINKIDLPSARPAEVKAEVEDIIGIPAEDAPEISAKNGINIHSVLEMIVKDIPAPKGDREAPLQALIFDSQYDAYRGVIVYTRVKEGTVRAGMDIRMMATGATYKVVEVGTMHPMGLNPKESLGAGEVGYITASIKTVSDTRVGDTVTGVANPASKPLPGYRKVQPMVYSGVYPADGAKYGDLRDALEKLKLNDASMSYEPESSIALGFGFRCGFLGLLHMEIIQERLEREYNLDLITTAPNVVYRVTKTDGTVLMVDNPLDYPDPMEIELAEEPFVKANLIAPQEYVGSIMDLCQNRRGEFKNMEYLDANRVELHYEMPLNEIIYDFFDALKSRTRGYGSLDYDHDRLPAQPPGEAGHPLERRRGGCPELHPLCRQRLSQSPEDLRKAEGQHPQQPSSRSRSRPPSAARSSPGRPSRPCARTCWPSATAATSPERRSCWKSRRKARSACAPSAPCPCPAKPSWPS